MSRESYGKSAIAGRLWSISAKIQGIGFLIAHQSSLTDGRIQNASVGIGEILTDLGNEIDEIREELETSPTESTDSS